MKKLFSQLTWLQLVPESASCTQKRVDDAFFLERTLDSITFLLGNLKEINCLVILLE